MNKNNNFPSFRNAFSDTVILTFMNSALAIIAAIFLARYLGPSSRGELAIIITSVTILSAFTDIYQGGNEITLGKNGNLLPKILTITIIGGLLFTSLIFLIIQNNGASNFFLSSYNFYIKLVSCIFFFQLVLYDGLKRILNAKQEFFFINRIDFFHSCFYLLILITSVIYLEIKVLGVLVILCAVNGVRLFLVLYKIYFYIKSLKFNDHTFEDKWYIEFFRIGKRNFLWSIPYALIQRVSIWQIAFYSSNENVGIFRVATTITEIILMIPRSANAITRGKAVSEDGGWQRSLYTSKIVFIFGIITMIFFILFGWFLVPLVFGIEYLLVYNLGIILLASVSFMGSVFVLEAQIVSKMKFPTNLIFINYFCLFILLVLNMFLIPKFGILSAGYAFLITSFSLYLMYNLAFVRFASMKKRDIFLLTSFDIDTTKELFRTIKKKFKV